MNISFPCSGQLTKMVYQARNAGSFYLGIYEYAGDDFKLMDKMMVTATTSGTKVSNAIYCFLEKVVKYNFIMWFFLAM